MNIFGLTQSRAKEYPTNVKNFIEVWNSFNGQKLGKATISTSVPYLRESKCRVNLCLNFDDIDKSFNMTMFVVEKLNDIRFLNTIVSANKAYDHYSLVLTFLRSLVKPGTELFTYIRQEESLNYIKSHGLDNVDFNKIPLVELFTDGKWELVDIQQVNSTRLSRTYPIRFRTS